MKNKTAVPLVAILQGAALFGEIVVEKFIKLDTPETTLLIDGQSGENLYYGKKIADAEKYPFRIKRREYFPAIDDIHRENDMISFFGNGNNRQFQLELQDDKGNYTQEFVLTDVSRREIAPKGLPSAHGNDKTVVFTYTDRVGGLILSAVYTLFSDCDCIAVFHRLENVGNEVYHIRRFSSAQLDLDDTGHTIVYFDGAWARERQQKKILLESGVFSTGSSCGYSSNRYNPFWRIDTPHNGCYAVNLLYSGNHKEIAEATPLGQTRILIGLNDERFDWKLSPGEAFDTPQAVMLYAPNPQKITEQMHVFVRRHILRGKFASADRPVVLNSWEAVYFDFNRKKLSSLARAAKDAGAECFVLDDGWFGKRNNDTCSLGDWTDNEEKTGGLLSFSNELHDMGLKFGLWVEPEMISPDSELYRRHPEYALTGERTPIITRNQFVLDLVNPDVAEYVLQFMRRLLIDFRIDYIKWDCNRVMTDISSPFAAGGEYAHRYMLALYDIWKRLTSEFADVLFEGCSGGGNRYDLGILCYMPQIWTSDNTDCMDRLRIQEGTLAAYPSCTMSAHVSSVPNHQTGRSSPLFSRFSVAAAGVLGHEYNLLAMSQEEFAQLKSYTEFYKRHRRTLQYGTFRLLESAYGNTYTSWIAIAEDGGEAIATVIRFNEEVNRERGRFRLGGLDDTATYNVTIVGKTQLFTARGDVLNAYGLDLAELFDHDATNEPTALMLLIEKKTTGLYAGTAL